MEFRLFFASPLLLLMSLVFSYIITLSGSRISVKKTNRPLGTRETHLADDESSVPVEYARRKRARPHHSREILRSRNLICHYRGPFEITKKLIAGYQQLQMSYPDFTYRISDGQCELHNIPPGVDAKCQSVRYSIAENNKSDSRRKRMSTGHHHHWGIGEDDSRLGCAISPLRRFHVGCEARGVPVPIASSPVVGRLPNTNDYDYEDAEGVGKLKWQNYATVIMTEFVCYCDGQFCNSPPEAPEMRPANRENKNVKSEGPTELPQSKEKFVELAAVRDSVTSIIPTTEVKIAGMLQQPQNDQPAELKCPATSGVSTLLIKVPFILPMLISWASLRHF